MRFEVAEKIVIEELVGDFFSHVCAGDWWCLAFSKGQWLVAQDIVFPEESSLNSLLASADPAVLDGVDSEKVAKGITLHRNLRNEVTRIAIEEDGTLRLYFDNGRYIQLSTSTSIVYWQWCLNRSGKDPYSDYMVACFWPHEVAIRGTDGR
jgi:hypothetical protein